MSLKNDLIKHQIFIQRLGASNAIDITNKLDDAIKVGIKAIKENPEGLSKAALRVLHTDLIGIVHLIPSSQLQLLKDIAAYEVKFIAKRLVANRILKEVLVPTPSVIDQTIEKTTIRAISKESKASIKKLYTHFANIKASEIVLKVGDASLLVTPVAESIASLEKLRDGLFKTQSATLAGTTTTQSASVTRQAVYIKNDLAYVDWVTELDSDVCEDCEALGNSGPYLADDTEIPPEHWNCRCVLVPMGNESDE